MTSTQIENRLTAKANTFGTAPPTDITCTDSGYAALNSNVIDVIKSNLKNQRISPIPYRISIGVNSRLTFFGYFCGRI